MGVPVLGAVLTAILGRKLGSVATGLAMGALGWWITTSLLLALATGALAVLLVGVMGVGSARRSGWGSGPGMGGWGGGSGGGGVADRRVADSHPAVVVIRGGGASGRW